MQLKAVVKSLKICSIIFIGLSVIELINIFVLLNTELNIDGKKLLLSEIVFSTENFPLEGIFLWIFFTIFVCCFLIIGILFWLISSKKDFEPKLLAKYLVSFGMVILIFSFVKLEYITLLAKTPILLAKDSDVTLQTALYDPHMVPFSAAALWILFMAFICCYLVVGIVVTAGGLKWLIEMEEMEEKEKKSSEKKEEN